MKQIIKQARKQHAGTASIEMALVLPILLILLFAITEFGYLYQQYTALNVMQRSAARYLSKHLDPGINGVVDLTSDTALDHIAKAKQLILKGTTDVNSVTDLPRFSGLTDDDISVAHSPNNNDVIVITTQFTFKPFLGQAQFPNFLGGEDVVLSFQLPASMAIRVVNQ